MGRVLFAAIALLVVTVGTLAAGSRLPTGASNTNAWHTAKLARMVGSASESERTESLQTERFCFARPEIRFKPRAYFPSSNPLTHTGAFPQQTLRAPPRA